MDTTGIICEYNPLHLGHKKQFDRIKAKYPNTGIVCLMSGNYVQRGYPAVFDKSLRAKAAILSGADLVLELPITASLSSAEGFASEGVRILGRFCDRLCFGVESAEKDDLLATAQALLSEEFSRHLKTELDNGISFPAARQKALATMGLESDILSRPNDILGTEYCKAILQQNISMDPMPILREGNYHDVCIDTRNPSATALRACMENKQNWLPYIPEEAKEVFQGAAQHTLLAGETAVLYRLRTMTDSEFEALPYGSEGLWRKLMHNARKYATIEQIVTATKSKRYTRTRLDRMVMCAFLGITQKDMDTPAPYTRVLALNNKGREILKAARNSGQFPNAGESVDSPYQALEYRAGMVYSLFSNGEQSLYPEDERRIYYNKETG